MNHTLPSISFHAPFPPSSIPKPHQRGSERPLSNSHGWLAGGNAGVAVPALHALNPFYLIFQIPRSISSSPDCFRLTRLRWSSYGPLFPALALLSFSGLHRIQLGLGPVSTDSHITPVVPRQFLEDPSSCGCHPDHPTDHLRATAISSCDTRASPSN